MTTIRILIPTCERYSPLAGLTAAEVDLRWREHPPVVSCGTRASGCARPQEDWGGIMLDAVRKLHDEGCVLVYVILDDHPPVEVCHADFLNAVLPEWMLSNGAAIVSLNGAGQGRPSVGVAEQGVPAWVERVREDFAWRYTLHPALWRVDALLDLLRVFEAEFPADSRSAWRFERGLAVCRNDAVTKWDRRCYRVIGDRCAVPDFDWPRGRRMRARRRMADGVGAMLGLLCLRTVRERWESATRYLHRAYTGPYPLYWSGLMQRGKEHADAVRFLNLAGCVGLVGRLRRTLSAGDATRGRGA